MQVKFSRTTHFTGKTGRYIQSGIDIIRCSPSQNILLTPLTGIGNFGPCNMEIPHEDLYGITKQLICEMTIEDREKLRAWLTP